MSDESTPWSKDGWKGYVYPYPGTPIGLYVLRARKWSRVIETMPMTPQSIEQFDPEKYWKEK